jgi:hypothetical protein
VDQGVAMGISERRRDIKRKRQRRQQRLKLQLKQSNAGVAVIVEPPAEAPAKPASPKKPKA